MNLDITVTLDKESDPPMFVSSLTLPLPSGEDQALHAVGISPAESVALLSLQMAEMDCASSALPASDTDFLSEISKAVAAIGRLEEKVNKLAKKIGK